MLTAQLIRVIAASALVFGCNTAAQPTAVPSLATSIVATPSVSSSAPLPSAALSVTPSLEPTAEPTAEPTPEPTIEPTPEPTRTLRPGETPQPTPIDIAALLTAQIDVFSLGDIMLHVTIGLAGDSGAKATTVAEFDMEATDTASEAVLAATYMVVFARPASSAAPEMCTLVVKDGEHYQFIATDQTIAVVNPAQPPGARKDFVIGTSPLCMR